MIIECAWCDRKMGEKEPLSDKRVSHGICKKCSKKVLKESEEKKIIRCPYCDTYFFFTEGQK